MKIFVFSDIFHQIIYIIPAPFTTLPAPSTPAHHPLYPRPAPFIPVPRPPPVSTRPTVEAVCNVITEVSRGLPIQRYTDVDSMFFKAQSKFCLDFYYTKLSKVMRQKGWNIQTNLQNLSSSFHCPVSLKKGKKQKMILKKIILN